MAGGAGLGGGDQVCLVPLLPGVPLSSLELQTKVCTNVRNHGAEKVPTRTFSWLKVPTRAFSFKTLLRHYNNMVPKCDKMA